MMQRLASAGGIEEVESVVVAAAAVYELDPETVLSAARRDFIFAY